MKNLHWWLVLACVPLYGFWIVPYVSTDRPALEQSIQVEKNEATRLVEKNQALEAQQKALSDDAENSPTESIPVIFEQEYLLRDLTRIIQGTGFSTSGFRFTKGRNVVADAAEVEVNFSVEGPEEKITDLLRAIEGNQRFLGLESLSVSRSLRSSSLVTVSLNLYALAQRF